MTVTTQHYSRIQPEIDLYTGCLLGGAVGDALGAPVEFMSTTEIAGQFGPNGIQDYVPAFGKMGAITDDTQMTLFTAEGVVRSWVRAFVHAPCAIPSSIAVAYQRWLHTQGLEHPMHNHCLNGWLITQKNLFARRAPGGTCLSGLQSMQNQGDVAKNDSKGCGGVMRVAPIGMYFATLASMGNTNKSDLLTEAFETGCRSAAITHGHPTGQLSSGAFAAIIMQLLTGTRLELAIQAVMPLLAAHPDHKETTQAIERACLLAKDRPNDVDVLVKLGGGWIAEEALAIALYCGLSAPDFRSGVVLAVNHGGDSDSTGSMAGQLLGAMYGAGAIPTSWRAPLELGTVIESMAYDLATFPDWGPGGTGGSEQRCERYQEDSFDADEVADADTEEVFDLLEGIELPEVTEVEQDRYAATEVALADWVESFRADAKSDNFQSLQRHLRNLELPDDPALLLEGTISLVQMSVAYLAMDGQQVEEFLAQQQYDPSKVGGAPYQVTFDIHSKAYARVNLPASLRPIDLADLYGASWDAYKQVGYSDFWVSRVDGQALSAQEIAAFEDSVESDLRFDYGDDEVTFWFDPDRIEGVLNVVVQDVPESDDDDL
jgi:ADP-ribosyl-[dinitrogen reductase] hydrolase